MATVVSKMASGQNHTSSERGGLPLGCRKVFIQRDYSEGTAVKFQTKFPSELEGLIDRQSFEYVVSTLNAIYGEAEKYSSRTCCEGLLACFTAYFVYLCMETYYEKSLKRIAAFLDEQNETIWLPRGLLLTDPIERGLRVLNRNNRKVLGKPKSSRAIDKWGDTTWMKKSAKN